MDKKRILVTGGAGYIGSHMVEDLILNNYFPIVFDNLSNSNLININYLQDKYKDSLKFIEGDILNEKDLDKIDHQIDAVIHFAALKSVTDSIKNPLQYYHNNTSGVMSLLNWMKNRKVKKIIFSSTAAVYGNTNIIPVSEEVPTNPISPYGKSKLFSENIIQDFCTSTELKGIALRYFNVAGNSMDGSIGDITPNPVALIPAMITSSLGYNEFNFKLFGNNFKTRDGTAIRDFVHVLDLVRGHRLALEFLKDMDNDFEVINLGTEKGTTVAEIIKAYEEILNKKLEYTIEKPRGGDIEVSIASSEKAKNLLKWTNEYGIEDIIESSLKWYSSHKEIFKP